MNDITIIGAGPAGSAAAILLARGGRGVNLIEQHRFPRQKVCGECMSALGVEVLDRLGVLSQLMSAGAVCLTSAIIHSQSGESITTPLPRPMLGISRGVLDAIMLEMARQAGAVICQPARCESISHQSDAVVLGVRDLSRNTVVTSRPSLAILADGKSALGDPPPPTGDIGIKSHWFGVDGPADAIELFGCAGCYGGLAAIEGNRWNAAFSVPVARVRACHGNINALFADVLRENRTLAARLSRAKRVGDWLASPLPRFAVRSQWPPRVIPIGNAAAALEPIGGEGMGLAVASAELAAKAILASGAWTAASASRLRTEYRRLWQIRQLGCRTAARVVSSTFVLPTVVELLQCDARVATGAMRLMGKIA